MSGRAIGRCRSVAIAATTALTVRQAEKAQAKRQRSKERWHKQGRGAKKNGNSSYLMYMFPLTPFTEMCHNKTSITKEQKSYATQKNVTEAITEIVHSWS